MSDGSGFKDYARQLRADREAEAQRKDDERKREEDVRKSNFSVGVAWLEENVKPVLNRAIQELSDEGIKIEIGSHLDYDKLPFSSPSIEFQLKPTTAPRPAWNSPSSKRYAIKVTDGSKIELLVDGKAQIIPELNRGFLLIGNTDASLVEICIKKAIKDYFAPSNI